MKEIRGTDFVCVSHDAHETIAFVHRAVQNYRMHFNKEVMNFEMFKALIIQRAVLQAGAAISEEHTTSIFQRRRASIFRNIYPPTGLHEYYSVTTYTTTI
jgi:hypothetical protein